MYSKQLSDVTWNLLIQRIKEERCVPFLGAGANVGSASPSYTGLPLGGELAKRIAERLPNGRRSSTELARVSLEYEVLGDRPFLLTLLKEELPDGNCEPSPLLDVLAGLPIHLYVTTNYDHLLERALSAVGRDFKVLVQPAAGFPKTAEVLDCFAALEEYLHQGGTLIYKIHGTFRARSLPVVAARPDDDDPVIITEDDYIDFLTVLQSTDPIGVPNLILSRLTPSTLLFLGYGLQDWDFRTLHRGIIGRLTVHQQRKSLAIQRKPPEFWRTYWDRRSVDILDVDLYQFAESLNAKYHGDLT